MAHKFNICPISDTWVSKSASIGRLSVEHQFVGSLPQTPYYISPNPYLDWTEKMSHNITVFPNIANEGEE